MKGKFRIVNSQQSLDFAKQELQERFDNGERWMQIQITTEKQRSQLQNNSLHLWLTMVADALNQSGFDVRQVLQMSQRQEYLGQWKPLKSIYGAQFKCLISASNQLLEQAPVITLRYMKY